MADSLVTTVSAGIKWLFTSPIDAGNVIDPNQLSYTLDQTTGTGSDQVNKEWSDTRSVASGANDDLLLSGLTNTIFANTVTMAFTKIRAILVTNNSTTSGDDLLIGGAASHEWFACFGATGHKVYCPAGSALLLQNRYGTWTVTSGSADQLRIHNSGSNSISYSIAVIGIG